MLGRQKLGGVVVPIISPMMQNERLDEKALDRHFNWLLQKPIDGMYLCGGTGDGERLTLDERRMLADRLVPPLKRAGKAAVVHVGQTNLQSALLLAGAAAKAGADAVAAIPPRVTWEGCREYYAALARVGLPVLVYYIPSVTGLTATFADLRLLLELEGVEGIKISDWNLFLIAQIKGSYPEKTVFNGFDEMLLAGFGYGADGSIGTWANLFPELYAGLLRLAKNAQWNAAETLFARFRALLVACWQVGALPAFEEIMRQAHGIQGCFRTPLAWPRAAIAPEASQMLMQRYHALVEELAGLEATLREDTTATTEA